MRLIDADNLYVYSRKYTPDANSYDRGWSDALLEIVEHAPTIEPEQKKGKWIYNVNSESISEEWDCSECGQWIFEKTNYCPYCGAKMEEELEPEPTMEEFMYGQDLGNPEDGSL